MQLNFQVRYVVNNETLCFRHSVLAAINGEEVETEVDDFDDEHNMVSLRCVTCDTNDSCYSENDSCYSEDDDNEDEDKQIYASPPSLTEKEHNIKTKD